MTLQIPVILNPLHMNGKIDVIYQEQKRIFKQKQLIYIWLQCTFNMAGIKIYCYKEGLEISETNPYIHGLSVLGFCDAVHVGKSTASNMATSTGEDRKPCSTSDVDLLLHPELLSREFMQLILREVS